MKKNYIICLSILLGFVWISDLPAQDWWERMEDMPQATSWFGSCYDSISEKAYIFGGSAPSGSLTLLATTQIYDFKTDTWLLGADMPNEASAFSAEMVNGKIYIIGEALRPQVLTNVKEYDPVKDTFITKAQLPEIFYGHGSCVYNGLIYSFGGRANSNPNSINTVRTYDPSTDTWNELPDMPYPRLKSAVCIYEDEIYLFGDNPSLKYTPSDTSWTELDAGICEIWGYAVPIIDGNRILLFGGAGPDDNYPNPSNEIWAYYPATDTLVKFDYGMPFNRFTRGHVYNNYVYLFGGHYNNTLGSVTDTVWRLDLDLVSVEENDYVSRDNFILSQIYPNPFSNGITIEYELNQPETVIMTFYSNFGRVVDRIEEHQSQGLNKVVWKPNNLPEGIYHFRLEAAEQVASGKVVLVR
jgi:N-acetylneuraminic acid mutarotase